MLDSSPISWKSNKQRDVSVYPTKGKSRFNRFMDESHKLNSRMMDSQFTTLETWINITFCHHLPRESLFTFYRIEDVKHVPC